MTLTAAEWRKLISECNSVQAYINILENFGKDGIFNEGRKLVLVAYTDCVCIKYPEIATEVDYVLYLYLKTHYSSSYSCTIQ